MQKHGNQFIVQQAETGGVNYGPGPSREQAYVGPLPGQVLDRAHQGLGMDQRSAQAGLQGHYRYGTGPLELRPDPNGVQQSRLENYNNRDQYQQENGRNNSQMVSTGQEFGNHGQRE